MKSQLLSFNARDFIKGLAVAVLSAVFAAVLPLLQAGDYVFNWKQIGTISAIATISYLSKNFLTNSKDEILTPEPKNQTKI